ncbi:alcohol dehydrogenase [NADP(+)]-like [Cimex lectularius]|uniref:NADP-dependent oxidoreductase domain-containing protein n=1 Tax=Cimex lectularius TaxID=79782 RepID=A0A8I6SBB4_CIMLE|nr:alcohol dehydrogenase [NADP(+)]-like [Cimex lectularius]
MSKYAKLRSSGMMPTVGFGTWQTKGDELKQALNAALEAGYRHFDTATAYENEEEIGEVLNEWMSSGRVKREELFIVTKLPPFGMRPSGVHRFLNESLRKLQLDYLDLYYMHCPFGFREGDEMYPHADDGSIVLDMNTDHVAIWKTMEEYVKKGVLKAIGVSNFNARQLQRVYENAEIKPSTLQVELHLYNQQKELVDLCQEKGMSVTAYSPLGSKGSNFLKDRKSDLPPMSSHPVVLQIAETLGKSTSQVLLRYIVQKGITVIPKSTTPSHIQENIQIYDMELTDDMMSQLAELDQGEAGRLLRFDFFKGVKTHPEYPFPTNE